MVVMSEREGGREGEREGGREGEREGGREGELELRNSTCPGCEFVMLRAAVY